jgi:FkbM family methyltransferase
VKILRKIIDKISQDNDFTLVSVGANNGLFVEELFFFDILKQDWNCLFIEPIKESFDKLIENYSKHYPLNKFKYENSAVFINEGIGELTTSSADDSFGMCSFFRPKDINSVSMPVNLKTFKSILDKHQIKNVDFLKVDCEGFDYEVILQLLDVEIYPKLILFEDIILGTMTDSIIKGVRGKHECLSALRALQYTIVSDEPEVQFESANKFAVRKDINIEK